jgi:hypothetical protein
MLSVSSLNQDAIIAVSCSFITVLIFTADDKPNVDLFVAAS